MRWRLRNVLIAGVLIVGFATPTFAQVESFTVAYAGGQWGCSVKSAVDPSNLSLKVNVTITGGTGSGWVLTYGAKTADLTLDTAANAWTFSLPTAQVTQVTLALNGKVTDPQGKVNDVACPWPPSKPGPKAASSQTFDDLDGAAQEWLASADGKKQQAQVNLPPNVGLLVHLPSGAVAPGSPASITESRDYQLAVLVDRNRAPETAGWHVDVSVTNCNSRNPFQILGDSLAVSNSKQALRPGANDFQLLLVGQAMACGSGQLTYTLTISHGLETTDAVATAWTVRPFYHLAAAFTPGFDRSKTVAYPVVSQTITKTSDPVGLTFDVGFIWYPAGIDFQAMRWYNRLINPFAVFRLSALTNGFVAGDAFTVSGGIYVGVGYSINKSPVLSSSKVGDPFTGSGQPTTRSIFDKDGTGWYFGVLLDQNVFKAIQKVMAAK
jgi:hypothetical protein